MQKTSPPTNHFHVIINQTLNQAFKTIKGNLLMLTTTTTPTSTANYFEHWHFYKADKRFFCANYWLDTTTGEGVKLTHNVKAVYFHKLDQYKSFVTKGKTYNESHQTVADKIGVCLKTVEEVAIPLLKRMGLIHIEKLSHKRYVTTVFGLDNVRGELVNEKLSKHVTPPVKAVKSAPITYEQLQNIEKNKKKLARVKSDMTQEWFMLTKDDMERLRKGSV